MNRRQALGALAAPFAAHLLSACQDASAPAVRAITASGSLNESVRLICAADSHNASRAGNGCQAVAELIRQRTGEVCVIGDNAGLDGSTEQYRCYDDTWGFFRDRTLPQPGNHDYHQRNAGPYFEYFGTKAGERGKGWYAITRGSWRLYFLNSEHNRDQQTAWLADDLPRWPDHHKAGFWHKPMFASQGGPMPVPSQVGPWWRTLQQHGGEFVFSGHIHRYERFPRMSVDGARSPNGIREFMAGTGGGTKMAVTKVHPLSEVQIVKHGILQLDLYPTRYEWRFIDTTGSVLDSGSEVCR